MDIDRFVMQIEKTLKAFGVGVAIRAVMCQDEMIILPPGRKGVVG